ncbi:LysR family transcriptional regulator [Sphingomonas immobilis]|uniref:LysR family transcriptional regulator n=1 Tax=Sphingomonas immobilis TaxID=3063997 RepID=A0ABT9A4S0_9SPHN|nr:LysR family transcriptional regulator [Sphingomonas sp. CA1-15]MDO7844427.1 LysR family transcriptional regulator [Sphingomonas sp. CA1-15]
MRLPDLEAWAIFASVVEHRSFSGAADALGASKATVSKAISRLELRLGQSLFHRTSRRLTLTESGTVLADHARRILADAEAAEEAAHDAATAPEGLIRMTAPMTLGLVTVAPVVADFLKLHPGIEIDLNLSDAKVDIVAEGIDVALRIANLPDSSLRARRIGPITTHIVAAPGYLAKHGRPTHPAQLGEHAVLGYTNLTGPLRFTGPNGEEAAFRPAGPLRSNSGDALLPALRAGIGIAMLPDFIVDADLASGTLQAILTDWSPPPIALHLMTPPGNLRPARVEALIAYLAENLRKVCPD